MELIKCKHIHLDDVSALYSRVVEHLEETINYPKWSKHYPCRENVKEAIQKGEPYAYMENGDPLAGHWGIGGYMVERCIGLAMSSGYKAIRIDVVPDNIPAINLYEQKGFTFAGTKDLLRNIDGIPLFSLYELNFD